MFIEKATVEFVKHIKENIYQLKCYSPLIASNVKPGQFCNIKVSESDFPLLRRPFSVSDVDDKSIYFLFDIHGEGTAILSTKREGDILDILGPLGNGFDLTGSFENAVIIAGGLGIAPFPFLVKYLEGKKIVSFVGARDEKFIVPNVLDNILISTDNGSLGYKGTVIDLLKNNMNEFIGKPFRIFSCGPNPMLKALQIFSIQNNYDCQISVECAMACGFGICQGCPIDRADGEGYKLVCKDGPVFNAKEVLL